MLCASPIVLVAIVLLTPQLADAQATERHGNWEVTRTIDPINDANTSYALPRTHSHPDLLLGVRCGRDGGEEVVLLHKYLGGDSSDRVVLVHRFDRDPALGPDFAQLARTGETSFPAFAGGADQFIASAEAAGRLVLRVTDPLDGEVLTSIVRLNGFTRAVDELACPPRMNLDEILSRAEDSDSPVEVGFQFGNRTFDCPSAPFGGVEGQVVHRVTFDPRGRYVADRPVTRNGVLNDAVQRVISRCRAQPLPPQAPQVNQTTQATFRFPSR